MPPHSIFYFCFQKNVLLPVASICHQSTCRRRIPPHPTHEDEIAKPCGLAFLPPKRMRACSFPFFAKAVRRLFAPAASLTVWGLAAVGGMAPENLCASETRLPEEHQR